MRFYVDGTKTVWYEGEWIEADTEENAEIFYRDAVEQGLVGIREQELSVDACEAEEETEKQDAMVQ